jgi:hypothetical protein
MDFEALKLGQCAEPIDHQLGRKVLGRKDIPDAKIHEVGGGQQ